MSRLARGRPADRSLLWVDKETHYLLKLCATYERRPMMTLLRALVRDEARRCGIELDAEPG